MKKALLGALSIAVVSGSIAWADGHLDPIQNRKDAMAGVSTSMGALSNMAKGTTEFNAWGATAALRGMSYAVHDYGNYFPEGSTGENTTASPKIWEDMAGFKGKLEKFQADIANAIANGPQDAAAIGPIMQTLGGNCKGCHETYRIKKQ